MKIINTHTLVGRTRRAKEVDLSTNEEKLEKVLGLVRGQFGERPMVVVGEERLTGELSKYPEFYIAGWFLSAEKDANDKIQELVVVDHGSTMELARKALMNNIKLVWNEAARDV